jgi:hypothetical protein
VTGSLTWINLNTARASARFYLKFFSAGFSNIEGTLAIAALEIDFINSIQPAFDINFTCWNEEEKGKSIHRDFFQFQQYSVREDLQLAIGQVLTPKCHCATTSTNSLWAVLLQKAGTLMWGTNVFQDPGSGTPTAFVLPPVVN